MISNFQTFKFDTCLKVKFILQTILIIKNGTLKTEMMNDTLFTKILILKVIIF